MPRASARDEPSVSLFPFLAVLLCAMGALVVLLIALSQSVRDDALAATREEAKPVEPVLGTEPTPEPWTLPEAFRPDEALAGLPNDDAIRPYAPPPEPLVRVVTPPAEPTADPNDALRGDLADLERRLRTATADRDRAKAATKRAESTRRVAATRRTEALAARDRLRDEAAAARIARDRLATEREKLRDALAAAKADLADAGPPPPTKFEVIAHDGASGATKRPLLIECRPDGIAFLAEGVTLGAADLDGFTPAANPFAAGVDALIKHWTGRDGERPHVLLLVRPGGSVAYYTARRFLLERNDGVGYELLAESVELLPPERDEAARQKLLRAIAAVPRPLDATVAAAGPFRGGSDRPIRLREGTTGFEVADLFEDPTRVTTIGRRGGTDWIAPPTELARRPGRGPGEGARSFEESRSGPRADPFGRGGGVEESGPFGLGDEPPTLAFDGSRPSVRSGTPAGSTPGARPPADFGFEAVPFDGNEAGGPEANGPRSSGERSPSGSRAGSEFEPPTDNTERGFAGRPGPQPTARPNPSGSAPNGPTPSVRPLADGRPAARPANPFRSAMPDDADPLPDASGTAGGSAPPPAGPTIAGVTSAGAQTRWGPGGGSSAIGLDRRMTVTVADGAVTADDGFPVPLAPGGGPDATLSALLTAVRARADRWPQPPPGFRWSPALELSADESGRVAIAAVRDRLPEFGLRLVRPRPSEPGRVTDRRPDTSGRR